MGVKQNGVKLFLKERSYTCKNKVHIRSSKTIFFFMNMMAKWGQMAFEFQHILTLCNPPTLSRFENKSMYLTIVPKLKYDIKLRLAPLWPG